MHVYGSQLAPLLEALVTAGGLDGISPEGRFHERALWRAASAAGSPRVRRRPTEQAAMGSESARPRHSRARPGLTRLLRRARVERARGDQHGKQAQAPFVTSPVITSGDVNCALNRARIARSRGTAG